MRITTALAGIGLIAGVACDDASAPAPTTDIVEVAAAAGSFTTLVAALEAADLVTTLKSEGPFTVFAPTDDAFAALPPGTVEDLLKPENKAMLQGILTYHVVPGRLLAADVVERSTVTTAQGQSLDIVVNGESVRVGGANLVQTDIEASNGVIHVIDAVLLPN